MTAKNEREIFDGCSRPRLTPLTRSVDFLEEKVWLEEEAVRRAVANRVGGMVDWGKMYDHRQRFELGEPYDVREDTETNR